MNELNVSFPSLPENEGVSRVVVAAMMMPLMPTVAEVADVKTAVSEAVTNAIVHGYEGTRGMVRMRITTEGRTVRVEVSDTGRGIRDIPQAMEPFYTSHPEQERSGMGFAVMQTFMDDVSVDSTPGKGTTVRLVKRLCAQP